ncbi:MAG TPA: hypothetical protein EYG20_00125 [Alcanivorax sp.]|nr:hypothetical protein [Alcanivorax sp.]
MSMLKTLLGGLALAMSMGALAQPSELTVDIRGVVLSPGSYSLPVGARLNDAARTGQVSARAWFHGAALLRQSAMEPQQRLKSGTLFEINANRVHAQAENRTELLKLLDRFYEKTQAMPVTGRIVTEMDPLQQLILANNGLLEDGDRLLYPARAEQVRVTGAVKDECVLPYQPGAQPVAYLEACPRHEAADPSVVYLIQPNGEWSVAGVAAWNSESANIALGAVIYVPLKTNWLSPIATGLNDDMAAFLATQYYLGGRFAE